MIMKQQIPEEYPINFIPLRGKDVPFVALCISIVISFVANQVTDLPFIIFGFYISWIYLRFYQTTYDGIVEAPYKGDHSDSFAFHTLFPSSLQPFILPVSNYTYNLARSLKIVSELRTIQSNNQSSNKTVSLSSNFDSIFMDSPAKPSQHASSSTASALLEKHIEVVASEQQPIGSQTTDRSKRRELAVQELEKRIQNMNI
ncbi:predicted protein [Naegleria gruberi]|uniref:Predicted protein n=1 Tax=Naegleria gruberi TaxID=5762 RepID=D2VAH1_NAEGR|nr:uncharacterized protein NAEGRDRAFT_65857 [Naegleria gruberi]EFC46071.1 predicted protein [Naegleria gruberi]|eukprot:XP_002678815.1 predicted protein [Naegleria gruberi strain NEG-M]